MCKPLGLHFAGKMLSGLCDPVDLFTPVVLRQQIALANSSAVEWGSVTGLGMHN